MTLIRFQFKTANVLCDPVFAYRIGPIKIPGISYNRYRRAPLEVEDLPPIDAVVISHNHYDHLDYDSVKLLYERFEDKIKWCVSVVCSFFLCVFFLIKDRMGDTTVFFHGSWRL